MIKDISGNILTVGDDVFLVRTFVSTHYAHSSKDFDEFPEEEIQDKELEEARENGFYEAPPFQKDDNYYKYIKDPHIDEAFKEDFSEENEFTSYDLSLTKNDKVEILSLGGAEEGLPTGRVLGILLSSIDKMKQLKISTKTLRDAISSGTDSVVVEDYLLHGAIPKNKYYEALNLRNNELEQLQALYIRPEQRESRVYVQLSDTANKNAKLKAYFTSLVNYVNTESKDNKVVLVPQINDQAMLKVSEEYRAKLPAALQDLPNSAIVKTYPNSIISSVVTFNIRVSNLPIYNLVNKILLNYLTKQPDASVSAPLVEEFCKKLVEVKPEYKYNLKSFNIDIYISTKDQSSKFMWLDVSQKEDYFQKISQLQDLLKYSDGYKAFYPTEISKIASISNINNTTHKLAMDIENWLLYNESKILKSIFG